MLPHSKFSNQDANSILRAIREQEKLAEMSFRYPIEKVDSSRRSNALPPLNAKSHTASNVAKTTTLQTPSWKSQSDVQCNDSKSHIRKFSDDSVRYGLSNDHSDANGNYVGTFDSYLSETVKKRDEDRLFTKTQKPAIDDEVLKAAKRQERPKSAYYGRRRPQTGLKNYSEKINLSFDG